MTNTQTHIPDPQFALIGEAVSLLAQTELYGSRSLSAIGDMLLPPMALGQIRIWRRGVRMVGLATWASLDPETEVAVLEGDHALAPQAWACGPRPVVMDFAAPYGGGFAMGRDLLRSTFPGQAVRALRRAADGTPKRIVQFPGCDAAGQTLGCAARAA